MLRLIKKNAPILTIICVVMMGASCVQTQKQESKKIITLYAGGNPELSIIYEHALTDKKIADEIYFLLSNIENKYYYKIPTHNKSYQFKNLVKDVMVLKADSLLKSIYSSVTVWNDTPWKDLYSNQDFKEYVLPHKITHEPLEYYWKEDCYNKYRSLVNSDDVLILARNINDNITMEILLSENDDRLYSYSEITQRNVGKCDDRSMLTVMAMRSVGIPAAFDLIPFRGNVNNGHSMSTVILPDGKNVAFNKPNEEGNVPQVNKTPKIYRHTYSVQDKSVLYKYKQKEYIPEVFSEFNLIDVTNLHAIESANLYVDVPSTVDNKLLYLSVFSPYGWQPIDYAENLGKKTVFEHVGTGAERDGEYLQSCQNMGEGIVYLPIISDGYNDLPVGFPIIHNKNKPRVLKPCLDSLETVVLRRKYPRMKRIVNFANTMMDGMFEASNNSNFNGADILHFVYEPPLSHMQEIPINNDKKYKYVRFRKATGIFNLGELQVFDKQGKHVKGRVISSKIIANDSTIHNIADDNPLSYYSISGLMDVWVGLELPIATNIGNIKFCPRTDDNDICPDQMYELLYWDDEWVSLGNQKASDYLIKYTSVPKNSLLWLRNLTKGREERPFTYDNNFQVWW